VIKTLLAETQALLNDNTVQLTAARERERKLQTAALVEHLSMPEHYWQPRHTLECRRRLLLGLLEVLEEMRHEQPIVHKHLDIRC